MFLATRSARQRAHNLSGGHQEIRLHLSSGAMLSCVARVGFGPYNEFYPFVVATR